MQNQFIAVVLATGAVVSAQESRGPFVGAAAVLSVDPSAPAGANPAASLLKVNGFPAALPTPWPAGPTTLDLAAILAACGPPGIDVDDTSMGEDWILADNNNGRIALPPNRWAAITFSVTASTLGAAGSRIATERAASSVGGDVFSWVLPGSALPAPVVGRVERAHDSAELGFGLAAVEVDGLDHLASLRALDPALQSMLPPPAIFFTVSSNDVRAGIVPTAWFGGTLPSGASILRIDRLATGWGCPHLWLSYNDLGLLQTEDIDALAIDLARQRLLFSTRTATRNPVLFGYFGADLIMTTEYKTQDGTPVSSSIGLVQNDDVDAICAMDPSVQSTAPVNASFFWGGTLRPQFFAPVPTLGASAFRAFRAGNIFCDTWMVGWPPVTGQGPGFAVLAATFADSVAPVITLGFFARNPANPIAGDPQAYSLLVPPAFSLIGLQLTFRWFATDAAATELAEAWPVRVQI